MKELHNSYKEIKNYIHNDLGYSRKELDEYINKIIEEYVNKRVEKLLNDKNFLEETISKEIIRQLRREEPSRSYLVCTVNEIYSKIDKIIHDEVTSRLIVELKPKDSK